MRRDYKVYLTDIAEAARRIRLYIYGLEFNDFINDELKQDGVIRNLEIIGEAVKRLPEEIKSKAPTMEWKKIAAFRDILIHEYFGVDLNIVWDVAINKLPQLKDTVEKLLEDIEKKR